MSFTVFLNSSAHSIANQFCKQHHDPAKAKQVYLNTLAVSAVNFYLKCMGFETDLEFSQSYDGVMQTVMNVADLDIKSFGKLECCTVLPDAQTMLIAPEVWTDRIGYVAVQLDPSLQTATLLGFTDAQGIEEFPLNQLRSLDELLDHLRQLKPIASTSVPVQLSTWFTSTVDSVWQSLESLLGTSQPNLAFSLRNDFFAKQKTVQRAKLMDLGVQLNNRSVILLMAIASSAPDPTSSSAMDASSSLATSTIGKTETQERMEILAQLHPGNGELHLPANISMQLCSETGTVLQEVQSRSQDNYIQLKRFRGMSGERFTIQIVLGETSVLESFMI
jgi:hypothetical protein